MLRLSSTVPAGIATEKKRTRSSPPVPSELPSSGLPNRSSRPEAFAVKRYAPGCSGPSVTVRFTDREPTERLSVYTTSSPESNTPSGPAERNSHVEAAPMPAACMSSLKLTVIGLSTRPIVPSLAGMPLTEVIWGGTVSWTSMSTRYWPRRPVPDIASTFR